MKKRFLRCIFPLFSLFLTTALVIPSAAQTITAVNAEKAAIVSLINSYDDTDTTFSVAAERKLKNVNGESSYTYYALRPYGYAVLRNDNHVLSEACFQENATLPIDWNDSTQYYYVGPSMLATRQDGALRLNDGTVLADEALTSIRQTEGLLAAEENALGNFTSVSPSATPIAPSVVAKSVHPEYFTKLTNAFGFNGQGTCTVLAACILLGFYDTFVHDKYVGAGYRTAETSVQSAGTTEAFHQLLCDFVYGNGPVGGIHIHNAINGFNNYLARQEMSIRFDSNTTESVSTVRAKVITMIERGHPLIASMGTNYGADIDHTVVVYGYRVTSTPGGGGAEFSSVGTNGTSTSTYRVHYGWHDTLSDVWVSSAWFYRYGALADCVLNNAHIMDSLGYVQDYHSGDQHFFLEKKACSSCGGNTTSTWVSFPCNGRCGAISALDLAS